MQTDTLTLTDFLLARIAEDEELASETHLFDCIIDHIDGREGCSCTIPARVLAECEAKRQIVEEAQIFGCGKTIARLLALPYADHPDYRPEWRP